MLGFTQPGDDNEEDKNAPELPPAFHPLLERMDEQENRYEYCMEQCSARPLDKKTKGALVQG